MGKLFPAKTRGRKLRRWGVFWLVAGLCLAAGTAGLRAQNPEGSHVRAQLLSEVESIRPGQSFWVGIHLKMDEGWHTYWMNPGDSGLATKVQWRLPRGFQAGPILWPYPEKIVVPPLASYGYTGEVLLLTRITAGSQVRSGTKASLAARVEWLECADICLPGKADLRLDLPVARRVPRADPAWVDDFAQARARLPLETSDWTVTAGQDQDSFWLWARPPRDFPAKLTGLAFFPDKPGILDHAAVQQFWSTQEGYGLEMPKSSASTGPVQRLEGVLVADDGWRGPGSEQALRVSVDAPAAAPPSGRPASRDLTLGLAILFSFVGGLLLNLMPCVLPVLSLKILGFVQQSREEKRAAGVHGVAFTAGVLVSFWILAGLLLVLRAGGEQLGWGFQLQSPVFVAGLALLFFLLALNFLGVFEVGTSWMGLGAAASRRRGVGGSFLSGVAATVVATPCTAPFMGTALGFALTQGAARSLLIFTFLGLGMASPYLILSSAPVLLRFVPRPGPWMESLKQGLSFLLFATVVWLAWVLGSQTDIDAVTALLAGLVLFGIAAWVLGRWAEPQKPARVRRLSRVAAAALLAAGAAVALSMAGTGRTPVSAVQDAPGAVAWEPYSAERVEAARQQGRPVFIDFTAAWCLTCQANKRLVLNARDVVEKFQELNVAAFRADWTSRDDDVTRALQGFGRSSVPLYVLYSPRSQAEPRILPEILTTDIVLDALNDL